MTAEQAKLQIMAEEFSEQVAVLTEKVAIERVARMQAEQEARRIPELETQIRALEGEILHMSVAPDPEDDPS